MIFNEYPHAASVQLKLAQEKIAKNMHTHLARLQYHHPLISPRSPQVLGGSKWKLAYPIMAWRQGATPPGAEPADRASHLGSREPTTGPSIPVPCPLGLQPVRQTGRAGGDQRFSFACQTGSVFDDSSIQWGQKCAWFTLFNAMNLFLPQSLVTDVSQLLH